MVKGWSDFSLQVVFILIMIWLTGLSCDAQESRPGQSHHSPNGFRNPHESEHPGFLGFLKWRWRRLWQDSAPPETHRFTVADNDPGFLAANRSKTTLTWIGHATVLLQLAGKNILTDPQFSDRASPFRWIGPKRVVPPGLALEELPEIDVVVISHDHYDSLDEPSVRALHNRRGGRETTFFVPSGLKAWFTDLGISRVVELDWWDKQAYDGLEVICIPVHHWSQRSVIDRNSRLWAGWAIRSNDFGFFFCGDTGYSPVFKEIGKRLGPFDLAAIPIGAYEPRWFMKFYHVNPEEAVQIHSDVHSKKSIGIHWGTFPLTDEPLDEPPRRLSQAVKSKGLRPEAFGVLKHGETIVLDSPPSN